MSASRKKIRDDEAAGDAYFACLLSRDWSLMSKIERRDAVRTAKTYGAVFAKDHPDRAADRAAYVDMCVWFAFDYCKVINDVEFALWESGTHVDPRVTAFIGAMNGYRTRKAG